LCADPLWPWLGLRPATLRYVMYFRFMDDVTFGRSWPYDDDDDDDEIAYFTVR